MRVTGGFLGNRRVEAPGAGVRPTQDRVRQAMFSALAGRMAGCCFLDLCAGSGVVGIEAWSRGASSVWWVERHDRTYVLLKRNVTALCGDPGQSGGCLRLYREDARRFVSHPSECSFDIIFADPPYEVAEPGTGWVRGVLDDVARNGLLKEGGLFVMEQSVRHPAAEADGWAVRAAKTYGETGLVIYGQETGKDLRT